MFDPIDNDLRAAAKALRDVVTPAVDATNPIALQQLKLVIDWLDFYQERAPQWWRLDAFELSANRALGRELLSLAPPHARGALESALRTADELSAVTARGPAALRDAVTDIEDAVAQLVRDARRLDAGTRQAIERTVVAASKRWLEAQRAWYAPLSIEPNTGALPSLDDALRAGGAEDGAAG
jgi:hypothetical protein